MCAQGRHGAWCECNTARSARLWVALDDAPRDRYPRSSDDELTSVEVDIGPLQPARLTTTQPGRCEQNPKCVQSIVGDVFEERAQLFGGPCVAFLCSTRLRRLGIV